MPADNTRHLRAAAQRRAEQTRRRAVATLRRLDAAGAPVTLEGARPRSQRLPVLALHPARPAPRHRAPSPPHRPAAAQTAPPERQRASDASLLQRLHAATARITARIHRLEHDNQQLRDALARALGERRTADILGHPAAGHDTPNGKPAKLVGPR